MTQGWWDHLLHTPMRDLAWYDMIAAFGLIIAVLFATVVAPVLLKERWRKKRGEQR